MAGISLRGAAPDVPFLCHFRRATEITDAHPYAELTAFVAGWQHLEEAAYQTLGYFDGVHLARRASVPALFSVALMDEVCPPSTVFAAFNAYGGRSGIAKDIEVYSHNGHEGGLDYQVDRQLSWFAECFAEGGSRADPISPERCSGSTGSSSPDRYFCFSVFSLLYLSKP